VSATVTGPDGNRKYTASVSCPSCGTPFTAASYSPRGAEDAVNGKLNKHKEKCKD